MKLHKYWNDFLLGRIYFICNDGYQKNIFCPMSSSIILDSKQNVRISTGTSFEKI